MNNFVGNGKVMDPSRYSLHMKVVTQLGFVWNGCGNHAMWDYSLNHCTMVWLEAWMQDSGFLPTSKHANYHYPWYQRYRTLRGDGTQFILSSLHLIVYPKFWITSTFSRGAAVLQEYSLSRNSWFQMTIGSSWVMWAPYLEILRLT